LVPAAAPWGDLRACRRLTRADGSCRHTMRSARYCGGRLGSAFACSLIWRALRVAGCKSTPTDTTTRVGCSPSLWNGGSVPGGSVLTLHSGMVRRYLDKVAVAEADSEISPVSCFRALSASVPRSGCARRAGVPPDKIGIAPAYLPIETRRIARRIAGRMDGQARSALLDDVVLQRNTAWFACPAMEKLLTRHPARAAS